MKLSRLFVLSALWLTGLGVSAADLIERVAPEAPATAPLFGDNGLAVDDIDRTPAAFEAGKIYVLYNVAEGTFFSQGCNWATQAATASTPIAVRFTLPEGKTLEDAALLMTDYNRYTNSWKEVFYDSQTAMFTDRGSQAVSYFQLVNQGENVYRIQASPLNATFTPEAYPGFVGRDAAVTDPGDLHGRDVGTSDALPISPFLDESDGHYIDWQLFAIPQFSDWEDYFNAQEVYSASQKLKSVITSAEGAGYDVTEAAAVYNNEAATMAEIQAAIDKLQNEMKNGISNGTAESPTDATSLIQNPNFDNASSAGWSGTGPNMSGDGNHAAANVPEHYNKTFDTYQDLSGMPAGVYALEAKTMFRGTWDDHASKTNQVQFLYAKVGEDSLKTAFNNVWDAMNTSSFVEAIGGTTEFGTPNAENNQEHGGVKYYVPNNPSTARLYFEAGFYDTRVMFSTDGTARIGVKKDTKITDTDWCVFDSFKLKYYGNTAESFKKMVELNAPDYSGDMVTVSLLESYQSSVESLIASTSDKATAMAALESLKSLKTTVETNIALWGQWLAALENAVKYTTGDYAHLQAAAVLGEYIGWEGEEQKASPTWDDETIKAEIDHIAQMIEAIKEELNNNVTAGTNVTEIYIGEDDAKFVNGQGGWSLDGACNFGSGAAEAYNQKFDLYKEIQNPQVGVYELELQGFFRLQRDQVAFDLYTAGEQDKSYAWIYLNENKNYVTCVFDEPAPSGMLADQVSTYTEGGVWKDANTDNWYANTMQTAAEAFNAGMYKTKAYGLVSEAGTTLRLGVTGDMTTFSGASGKGQNWMIWDNFKLTYMGFDAATIQPILEAKIEEIDLTQNMGKSIYDAANEAVTAAQEAISSGDGEKMFIALKQLFAANSNIAASVALFKNLVSSLEGLQEQIQQAEASASQDVIGEAGAFYEEVMSNIPDHKYEDADVPELMKKIKELTTKLRLPDYSEASELNPVDFTSIIVNPGYQDVDEGTPSTEGWEGTGIGTNATALNAEIFNTTPFDHYQEFYGLPAGKYIVKVMGFYRYGGDGPAMDYTAYNEDASLYNNVLLYADGVSISGTPLVRLAQFADAMHAGEDGWAEVAEGLGLYVANSMVAAGTFFDEQQANLESSVEATVGSDGHLRIGLRKDEGVANDWCLFDNWTMTYLGKGETITGDVNGDGAVNVADISAIISDMAGMASYADADVNGDGTVNVADISFVITLMAEKARKANLDKE